MTELGITDPVNVTGMSLLLNTEGMDEGFDPQALEREIARGMTSSGPPAAPKRSLAEEFVRDIEGIAPPVADPPRASSRPDRKTADPFSTPDIDLSSFELDDDLFKSLELDPIGGTGTSMGSGTMGSTMGGTMGAGYGPGASSDHKSMTHEEQRRQIINKVYGSDSSMSPALHSIEKEREDDEKAQYLQKITTITEVLEAEGEDVSKIPKLTLANSMIELKTWERHLTLKNNNKRCTSFAEEFIMLGIYGIEWIFDGKKKYFGHQIDMRGWNKTIQTKLRRARHDTSVMVNELAGKMNPLTMFILDIIPSGILYSRIQKSRAIGDHVSDAEFSSAFNNIRDHE